MFLSVLQLKLAALLLQNTEDDTYYYEYPYYEDMESPTTEITEAETSETDDPAAGRVT